MPTNAVGAENITLLTREGPGTTLTVPSRTLTALIRVKEGGVNFSLDGSDPSIRDPLILERGQSINFTHSPNMRSVIEQLRLKLAEGHKQAKVLVLYFE